MHPDLVISVREFLGVKRTNRRRKEEQNMKTKLIICALAALSVINGTQAQSRAGNTVPVTVENYNRAQTDIYFAGVVKIGGFGNFRHGRELAAPVQQGIVRPNRDTLYSFAIVDLDAGPVTAQPVD